MWSGSDGRRLCAGAETLDEHPVTETAIAHGHRLLLELRENGPDDARTGEDDLRAFRLEPDDFAPAVGVPRPVQLDLAIDLREVEDRAVDDVRVVRREGVLDGRDVRHAAAHPDDGVRLRAPVEPRQVGADRGQRLVHDLVPDRAVQAELVRIADGADVHAESLVDPGALAEGELRAAPARVEDDRRAVAGAEARDGSEIGEPALVLAGDHVDRDSGRGLDRREHVAGVARHPQPGRADRDDRDRVVALRFVDHPGDGGHGPLDRGWRDRTRLLDPFAQPAHIRSVGDGAEARAVALGDVELHRVRPDIDHRVALGTIADEGDEALRIARVQVARQAGLADGLEHRGLVLRFDRDRLRRLAVRDDVRHLGGAAVDLVADASLVHPDRPDRAAATERC